MPSAMDFSGKLCVSFSSSGPSCSVQVSGRTCQWSAQTFDSGGSMLDGGSWLPTVLNMLADVPQQYPIIKDLIMDVSVGQVLRGLQYLHLTLWQLSDVCYADGFSSSVCQVVAGATRMSTLKVYQQCWKEWAGWCA